MLRLIGELRRRVTKNAITLASPVSEEQPSNDSGYEFQECESPDKSRRLITLVRSGPKYDGSTIKELMLQIKMGRGYSDLMHVQAITRATENKVRYNVIVDAIDDEWFRNPETVFALKQINYSSERPSRYDDTGMWCSPIDEKQIGEDLAAQKERLRKRYGQEGFVFMTDLPEAINVEATVEAFMQQVKAGDFSRPALILRTDLPDFVR